MDWLNEIGGQIQPSRSRAILGLVEELLEGGAFLLVLGYGHIHLKYQIREKVVFGSLLSMHPTQHVLYLVLVNTEGSIELQGVRKALQNIAYEDLTLSLPLGSRPLESTRDGVGV